MIFKRKKVWPTVLSPHLREIWGFVPFRYLILATEGYIVYVDGELEVDWKSTLEWDRAHAAERNDFDAVLNRAASVESGDWDDSDDEKTVKFKRQIGEAIARGLDGNFQRAMEMLDSAEEYRQSMLSAARRREAIGDQVKLKNSWRRCFRGWTVVHYVIGICAILLSTLVAAKPVWLDEIHISVFAWLVAALTGLLTFLTPDKKADRYVRAWSALNSEITRYNTDQGHTVEDVLEACRYGENIVHETSPHEERKSRGRA
jgi:hypothetical protein